MPAVRLTTIACLLALGACDWYSEPVVDHIPSGPFEGRPTSAEELALMEVRAIQSRSMDLSIVFTVINRSDKTMYFSGQCNSPYWVSVYRLNLAGWRRVAGTRYNYAHSCYDQSMQLNPGERFADSLKVESGFYRVEIWYTLEGGSPSHIRENLDSWLVSDEFMVESTFVPGPE